MSRCTRIANSAQRTAQRHAACSLNWEQVQRSRSAGGGISIQGIFGICGQMHLSNFDAWISENCQDHSEDYHRSAFEYYAQREDLGIDPGLYQAALIKTHRDRAGDPPGRREAAGDAGHRQGFPTPSGGSPARPERRLPKAFGRRRARLAMPRIATSHAPCRKPWKAVSMGLYQCSLV